MNSVRESDGRGRHTTTARELVELPGGACLIDTPGMRELGMMGVGSSIDDSFSDVHELSRGCRFSDCSHTTELGCAILAAVESGSLDAMSSKVADFYEEEVDNAVDSMSSLLEPFIMAILGILVGGLVVAMYLPIFKLGQAI